MKRGFSLVEMLVVVGIIAALIAAMIGGYAGVTKMSEKTRCNELVSNVATAMQAYYVKNGCWPKRLATEAASGDGKLDETAAYALASGGYLSASYDSDQKKLKGLDRFGIVSPWATAVLKNRGRDASLTTVVTGKTTVDDHRLHFAVDLDGDGVTDAKVGGTTVKVRAPAMVWCGGKDGRIESYAKGVRGDDVYSWSPDQRVR